jgi:hypothetical protein
VAVERRGEGGRAAGELTGVGGRAAAAWRARSTAMAVLQASSVCSGQEHETRKFPEAAAGVGT